MLIHLACGREELNYNSLTMRVLNTLCGSNFPSFSNKVVVYCDKARPVKYVRHSPVQAKTGWAPVYYVLDTTRVLRLHLRL